MPDTLKLQRFSFRFAEQVLNSTLWMRDEVERLLTYPGMDVGLLSRPTLTSHLEEAFRGRGWAVRTPLLEDDAESTIKLDFLKDRVGMEIEFGHPTALGMSLLKFQMASPAGLNLLDVGIYVVTTTAFQERIQSEYGQKWNGSLPYERVVRQLPHFRSAIQVPIYVLGIDI